MSVCFSDRVCLLLVLLKVIMSKAMLSEVDLPDTIEVLHAASKESGRRELSSKTKALLRQTRDATIE